MDELDEIIKNLVERPDIRIPLKFKGDEDYEWTGGFIPDLDKADDHWNDYD